MPSILQIPAVIHSDIVQLKFDHTIKTSLLVNANFTVWDITDATPVQLSTPFQPINVIRDFYSTSRQLILYWLLSFPAGKTYQITISNLVTVTELSLDTENIEFDTNDLIVVVPETEVPSRLPLDVEDYSIKDVGEFLSSSGAVITPTSSTFKIESIIPSLMEAGYIEPSYREGRIEIYFTQSPAANFISQEYFKIQRKNITGGVAHWQNVNITVASNPEDGLVVIYLPSNDATPVYAEPDLIYWEEGYKYRLKISPDIGPAP